MRALTLAFRVPFASAGHITSVLWKLKTCEVSCHRFRFQGGDGVSKTDVLCAGMVFGGMAFLAPSGGVRRLMPQLSPAAASKCKALASEGPASVAYAHPQRLRRLDAEHVVCASRYAASYPRCRMALPRMPL